MEKQKTDERGWPIPDGKWRTKQCKCGFEFEWHEDEGGFIECGMCEQRYVVRDKVILELIPKPYNDSNPEWTARRPQLNK